MTSKNKAAVRSSPRDETMPPMTPAESEVSRALESGEAITCCMPWRTYARVAPIVDLLRTRFGHQYVRVNDSNPPAYVIGEKPPVPPLFPIDYRDCVYVMADADKPDRVKIGHGNVENRLRAFRTGNPSIKIIGVTAGGAKEEGRLHKLFDNHRVPTASASKKRSDEWFYLRGPVAEFVRMTTLPEALRDM